RRAARYASHARRRRNADHTPEGSDRNFDAGSELRHLAVDVDPGHVGLLVRELLRQETAVRHEAPTRERKTPIGGPDANFEHIARLGAADGNRTIQRVITAAIPWDSVVDGIEFRRNFLFWDAELFVPARVSRGGFEPHDVTRIDGEHRLQRGIEKA